MWAGNIWWGATPLHALSILRVWHLVKKPLGCQRFRHLNQIKRSGWFEQEQFAAASWFGLSAKVPSTQEPAYHYHATCADWSITGYVMPSLIRHSIIKIICVLMLYSVIVCWPGSERGIVSCSFLAVLCWEVDRFCLWGTSCCAETDWTRFLTATIYQSIGKWWSQSPKHGLVLIETLPELNIACSS